MDEEEKKPSEKTEDEDDCPWGCYDNYEDYCRARDDMMREEEEAEIGRYYDTIWY